MLEDALESDLEKLGRQRIQLQSILVVLPVIDQLLIADIKLGPNKNHEAINNILKLAPEWKRSDCWRRIRQLRRTPALAMLRVRDLRITQASLDSRCAKFHYLDLSSTPAGSALHKWPGAPCSWKRAAKVLNVEVADVQNLISAGTTETGGHICDRQGV